MGFFDKVKEMISGSEEEEMPDEGYVELDTEGERSPSRIVVRPFVLQDFEGVKPVLDALREGNTIALVNMRPLKSKDLIELKRAVNKIKKTTDAISGEIAGFGEDFVVVTPPKAMIYRSKATTAVKTEEVAKVDDDEYDKF